MVDRVVVDLSHLPRVGDGLSFLYTEHVRVERTEYAIELVDINARIPIPVAALGTLLLGPGSTITHAAVVALVEGGASIVWCGEGVARCYACGLGETRRGKNLEAQARAWASPKKHIEVVRQLYAMRFEDPLPEGLTLEQIRGHEGARVRDTYAQWSKRTGVLWNGRAYRTGDWNSADPINRALSSANACLYGMCHSAIIATGFSAGLGFVHIGKQLSFVYDIADLYKMEISVPAAFQAVSQGATGCEARARKECRRRMFESDLLERIVPDMQALFGLSKDKVRAFFHRAPDAARGASKGGPRLTMDELATPPEDFNLDDGGEVHDPVGALWNEDGSTEDGGRNFASKPQAGLLDVPDVSDPDEDS